MKLYLTEDPSFNINNPYLYIEDIDTTQEYEIYCDGSYLRIGNKAFAGIGGVIINKNTNKKIGEFFGPLKTQNIFQQNKIPYFEKIAINTALIIATKFNMNKVTIFNDSLSDVESFKNNNNIRWISRKSNLGDMVVTYAKNEWKKTNEDLLKNIKNRQLILNNSYEHNVFISSFNIIRRGVYYFFAFDENDEIIEHLKFNKPNEFGEVELIIKILKNNKINNTNLNINKKLFSKINDYVNGDSLLKDFELYEKLFNAAEENTGYFSLVPKYQDFNLKKKIILKYMEKNKI